MIVRGQNYEDRLCTCLGSHRGNPLRKLLQYQPCYRYVTYYPHGSEWTMSAAVHTTNNIHNHSPDPIAPMRLRRAVLLRRATWHSSTAPMAKHAPPLPPPVTCAFAVRWRTRNKAFASFSNAGVRTVLWRPKPSCRLCRPRCTRFFKILTIASTSNSA